MRSKANIKTHPLHPILVVFPIAFFTGTFLFDILSLVYKNESFWRTGGYLEIAGVTGALLAAVPGLIDYVYTVPPESSAKKRAAKHGIINTTMLIIFFVAWLYRKDADANTWIIIALELSGIILMAVAGWMGGTLVHRNQIGVDIRYADAGKWKELYSDQTTGSVEVALQEELKVNQMKLIHLKNKRIVLARTENSYVAFDDRCTHKGASLAGGAMICGTVQCPWHGSQFDVTTGVLKAGPADKKIDTYQTGESDGKVYLIL